VRASPSDTIATVANLDPKNDSGSTAYPAANGTDLTVWVARALGGWIILIFLTAFFLRQPWAITPGYSLSSLEGLFVAVSAATGTGLSPVNLNAVLTPAGLAVLLAAIQIGGLLSMVLGAWLLWVWAGAAARARWRSFARFAVRVVALTFFIELLGAAALAFRSNPGSLAQHLGGAVFHAVSAFCNAGFLGQHSGLSESAYSPFAHLVVVPLMVLGSLGVPLILLVMPSRQATAAEPKPAASFPPGRSMLGVFAVLYLVGTLLMTTARIVPHFFAQLQLGTTSNMPDPGKLNAADISAALADASFLSASARGAGLTTHDLDSQPPATHVVLLALMPWGGAPGGAAGGIWCLALGALALRRWRAGRDPIEAFPRLDDLVLRLLACLLGLILVGVFQLSLFEPYPLNRVLFEVVAAVSNCGLSLGVTGLLTAFGKSVLIVLMLVGKIFPLWLLARALTAPPPGPIQAIP
jgi:trk system potassium uptake protein TrkH